MSITVTRPFESAFLSRSRASRSAYRIINAIQDEPLEYMAASVGLVLEAMCEVKNLNPSEVMTVVHNMLRTTGLEDDQYVEALKEFIKHETPDL